MLGVDGIPAGFLGLSWGADANPTDITRLILRIGTLKSVTLRPALSCAYDTLFSTLGPSASLAPFPGWATTAIGPMPRPQAPLACSEILDTPIDIIGHEMVAKGATQRSDASHQPQVTGALARRLH